MQETIDERISKRAWLLENFEYILRESVYHRTHKENFSLPRLKLWHLDEDESHCHVD